MAKQIIWAPEAVADRLQILDYWYKRLGTKEYSVRLDEMFKETAQILSRFPSLGFGKGSLSNFLFGSKRCY